MLVRTRFSNKTDIDGADHIVDAPFVGFDIETDGLYIERGARMREFAVVDRGGLRLGWSDLTSANSELSASLVARLLENLNEHIVVGHNLAFDLKFLAAEADRFDQYCPRIYCVDTLGLSRKLLADVDLLELPRFRGQLITDTIKRKWNIYDKAKKPVSSKI